ncbi:MAG: PDDEXK nuclease domain-containing protein [Thermodesulfobacteriota bacterium]
MMEEGDNPPIGILLCTSKNHALAEYALAGMDNTASLSPSTSLNSPAKRRCSALLKNR